MGLLHRALPRFGLLAADRLDALSAVPPSGRAALGVSWDRRCAPAVYNVLERSALHCCCGGCCGGHAAHASLSWGFGMPQHIVGPAQTGLRSRFGCDPARWRG
eukprot:4575192-Alexandrium_andersonii.AAC.1